MDTDINGRLQMRMICHILSALRNIFLFTSGFFCIGIWCTFFFFCKGVACIAPSIPGGINLQTISMKAEADVGNAVWSYLYWIIGKASPLYIKLMQRIGTRLDIFPRWLCHRCDRFQTDAPVHPYPYTVVSVMNAVKEKGYDFDVWVDPTPLGAGCVGQVHRVIIRDSTNKYSLLIAKVLHPGIREKLRRELNCILFVVGFLDRIPGLPWSSLKRSVEDFGRHMLLQSDLLWEAYNTMRFRRNLGSQEFLGSIGKYQCGVKVPKIFHEYSNSTVLFESYEEGIPLTDWLKLCTETSGNDPRRMPSSTSNRLSPEQHFLRNVDSGRYQLSSSSEHSLNGKNGSHLFLHSLSHYSAMTRLGFKTCVEVVNGMVRQKVQGCVLLMLRRLGWFTWHSVEKNHVASRYYREIAADLGLHIFLHMVFTDNFVHADLHGGNVLIRFPSGDSNKASHSKEFKGCKEFTDMILKIYKNEMDCYNAMKHVESLSSDEKYGIKRACTLKAAYSSRVAEKLNFEIVLLDCALATSLSARDYQNIKDLLYCICVRDGYTAGRLILERAPHEACDDRNGFCKSIEILLNSYFKELPMEKRLVNLAVGKYLLKMLLIARHYKVDLDASFISLILSALVVEGICKQLNPNIEPLAHLLPYIKKLKFNSV